MAIELTMSIVPRPATARATAAAVVGAVGQQLTRVTVTRIIITVKAPIRSIQVNGTPKTEFGQNSSNTST